MQHSPIDASGNADALDPRILRAVQLLVEVLAPAQTQTARDELVCIADCGIERAAVMRLIRSGELAARRIGRKTYVRRSDVVALVAKPAAAKPSARSPASPEVSYLAAIRQAKAKAR